MYISIKTLDYVLSPHHVYLSKTTKHWDGFVSHCTASGINLKFLMPLIPVAGIPNGAVDENIGAAEAYKVGVIFDHNRGGNVAPPWLAELTATVAEMGATIAEMAATVEANTATLQQVVADLDMVIF